MTNCKSNDGGGFTLKKRAEMACDALSNMTGFWYCEAGPNELRYYFDNDVDAENYKSHRLLQDVIQPMRVEGTVLIEYFEGTPELS